MPETLTTSQAASLLDMRPDNFIRYAQRKGLSEPAREATSDGTPSPCVDRPCATQGIAPPPETPIARLF